MRVYCGYGQWSLEQLLGEVARGDWALCPASVTDIQSPNPSRLWEELWQRGEAILPLNWQPTS